MRSQLRTDGALTRNRENPAVISGGGLYLDKRNFDLNLFCKYVSGFESARFAPKTAGPQPLGDFFAVDLNGGYTIKTRMPLRIYLRVRNLTDQKYSTVVGYPEFGRMMYIGMRLSTGK